MRVIAGSARGRPLKAPRGRQVRPTSDRVREALFSSLSDRIVGVNVLDLFAGTGALGIEALSRGAAAATFVERDEAVAALLTQNLAAADVSDRAVVVRAAVAAFAGRTHASQFHVIFCDPPYDEPFAAVTDILEQLEAAIAAGATVVVERDKRDRALMGDLVVPRFLAEDRRRSYGDTTLLYLTREEQATTWP